MSRERLYGVSKMSGEEGKTRGTSQGSSLSTVMDGVNWKRWEDVDKIEGVSRMMRESKPEKIIPMHAYL